MNILRLSIFNLKKNKKEAIAIAFLTMIASLMLGIFVANISGMHKFYEDSFKRSGSVNTMVLFDEGEYRDEYSEILKENYNISNLEEDRIIYAVVTDVIALNGEKISYNLLFVNERTEKKIENFAKKDSLSDEEISKLEHPIWLPVYFEISQGYKLGDTFTMIKNGKQYPMVVAGFYETGLATNDGYGFKCVISDEDMELFSLVFTTGSATVNTGLYFNAGDDFDYDEYIKKCEAESFEQIATDTYLIDYELEKTQEEQYLNIFLYIIAAISVITLFASVFMIRNKISNDIEDQMQSIGVLEALGYRSKEISLSYVYEYVISAGAGAILGVITAALTSSAVTGGVSVMLGREVEGNVSYLKMFLSGIFIVAVVTGFALIKARKVKKFPPVVAFRKGIKTHSFKLNPFPLEKTKYNVNLRIALKSFVRDIKTNIGMAACIILSGILMIFGVLTVDFFKNGYDGLLSLMAYDTMPIYVELSNGVDPYQLKEELSHTDGVRKCLTQYGLKQTKMKGTDDMGNIVCFDDFADAEDIEVGEGRFPEHYNEVMITVRRSRDMKLGIGDSVVLENNGIEKSYVITGIVSSIMNGGSNFYMTSDGYRCLYGNDTENVLAIYLEDGIDTDDFTEFLQKKYGTSKAGMEGREGTGSLEDRIRAVADEKMAVLLSQYGVSDVDYTIRIGDTLISGNSRKYMIKNISDMGGILKLQMGAISSAVKNMSLLAVILITIVVSVILGILTSSNVKRQRQSLGIMKGLGYSSKDLMKQMALRVMPVTVISVVIASFGGVAVNKIFWMASFGTIATTNVPLLLITGIVLVAFCYIVTYISAGKVKKISVTELMTE